MTLITCVTVILAATNIHALRISRESPIEVTKSIEIESAGATDLGNVLANVAQSVFNAGQCGKCGAQKVSIAGLDKDGVQKELFGDVFPMDLDLTKDASTCDKQVACDTSPSKECKFPRWHLVKKLLNQHLTPKVKDQQKLAALSEELKDTLVVHLRYSGILNPGNKYEKRGTLTYLPAPCAYITEAIKSGNFQKVKLVGEVGHPCIDHVQKAFPQATFEKQSILEDFMTLMSAKNIALATSSTFGYAATLLNPNEDLRIFMPTYSGKSMCCEGNFNSERLDEMCHIGQQSVVFEIPALANNPVPSNRVAWVLDDSKFQNAIAHKCS